jgi:hypothetical protein
MLFLCILLVMALSIGELNGKCVWYEGIRNGYNQVYLHGEPKPLSLNDLPLLNEMCPHISTRPGRKLVFTSHVRSHCMSSRLVAEFMLR